MRSSSSPMFIIALAVLCGASIDAAVKYVAADVSVVTIMAWRFLFGGALCLAIYMAVKRPTPSAAAIRFHAMRGAVQTVSAIAFFWSLTQLALAEATVIALTATLMVAPLARVILGEKMSALSGLAAIIGFFGAIIAVSASTQGAPENGDRLLGALACLLAAFLYALTLILMRLRTRKEDTLTIVMFTNVFPALYLLPWILATDPTPPINMLPIYVAFALAGVSVWWMMTTAYGRAEAQKLAPLEYTALIWASLYGWMFFGEIPGWQLWVGAAIIIAACMLVAVETRFRTRQETHLPASDILQ